MTLYAGASGFAYKEWRGSFYPETLKEADFLDYYARHVPAVEINNSFYRIPNTKTLEGWAQRTPESFRFVIKASRQITHLKRLKDAEQPTSFLFKSLEALGDRLGPVLFQLPPFQRKDLERLEAFLAILPKDRRVTFEFRHESWFTDDVFNRLREHGVALCINDVEKDEQASPFVATASWGYLRLRQPRYPKPTLRAWLKRIAGQSWTDTYVFFKHEDAGIGPRQAKELLALAAR
ncbi:MAG: DUF72 domain-containing protein [Alphaproteobacteria bacterium]|nr:DUF72 domain-containing protein [Alphaproteobacteria bacterium]